MKKLRLAVGSLISIAAVFALLQPQAVGAEPFDLVAEQGLQVSPAMVELNAEPGKSYVLDVNLLNVANSEQTYQTEYFDFRSKDDSGTPDVYVDNSLPKSASVRSWFTADETLSLASYQKKSYKITVTVPANAEPGGHYGVVSFTNGAPGMGDSERVAVQVKTGVLVLIRVAGDIKESLTIDSFTATSKNSTPFFIENAPIDFTARVRNIGNVHVRPQGSIEVRNMLGGLVGKTDFNKSAGNILPDSIRKLQSSLNADWMIGRYTATLTAGYGTNGQALMGETVFWVIPYKPILIVLLALLTVIFIIRTWLKSYRKHIIEETTDHHTDVNPSAAMSAPVAEKESEMLAQQDEEREHKKRSFKPKAEHVSLNDALASAESDASSEQKDDELSDDEINDLTTEDKPKPAKKKPIKKPKK